MTATGRPSDFHPDMCEQAQNYCLLGATNDELAEGVQLKAKYRIQGRHILESCSTCHR